MTILKKEWHVVNVCKEDGTIDMDEMRVVCKMISDNFKKWFSTDESRRKTNDKQRS